MPKIVASGLRQLPLVQMEYGLAQPVARLKMEPREITGSSGIQFEAARDDLDDFDGAVVFNLQGEQFALVRHRGTPQGGTVIIVNERSINPTEDLRRALRTLRCDVVDLNWVHPDVDRDALRVVTGLASAAKPTPAQRSQPMNEKDKRIYVERREQGDYAVRRAGSERASAVEPTQKEAIQRAREIEPGSHPHVERVRETDKGSPDKWRKA